MDRDYYTYAMANSTFASVYPGDSTILNELYAEIWNNATATEEEKW